MKLLVIALLIFGIVMIINGYLKQNMSCPPAVIKYRYIPQTFDQLQNDLPKPTDVFKTMFTDQGDQTLSF